MDRIAEFFLGLGYRRLPDITVDSITGVKGFIDLYRYPVFFEIRNHQFIVKNEEGLKVLDSIHLENVYVRKYFEKRLFLQIDYHSEYNIISLNIRKGEKNINLKLNPLVSLTNYRVKMNAPEVPEFADQICDCYNLFLDNNYKTISVELYREGNDIYFSIRKKIKKNKKDYDNVAIVYNIRTIGEYINDLFKRYGMYGYLSHLNNIKDVISHYSNVFIVIVNDKKSNIGGYINLLNEVSAPEKQFYCMYEGIDSKKVKGKLMRSNIIFTDDPYAFIKTVINRDR